MNYYEEALKLHEKHQGKIHTELNCEINTMDDMSVVYTPGVAEPCRKIAENEEDVYRYTTKSNTIAVVSNGTAVLGLGNIGAKASIPVMEGKAALFKKFGDVNAVPICLDTQDKEELIQTVKNIAPCFGGINLEDIASPDCFEIEERLDQMLDIPVFHDDQHGTAIVVLAGIMNADEELYEAGAIDGIKNRFQQMIYITIPTMKAQMLFGAVMAIVNTFNNGAIGVTLSGTNPTPGYAGQLIVNHIDDYGFIRYEMGYAAAVSVVLLLIITLFSKVASSLFTEKE